MVSPLRQRRTVHVALSALAAAFLLAGCTGPLAGNVLSGWTDAKMLTFFDTNNDDSASTKELRKGLSTIIVKVASQDAQYDLDGNGAVARTDIKAAVSFIRGTLQATCGNGLEDVWEECDDGNTVSGDGCSGIDHPNGPCQAEICGDTYLDPNGIPSTDQTDGTIWEEQCDDGGVCVGGENEGQACTSTAGGVIGERQCPNGNCTAQSFDGCQNNCLLEICGNGDWEQSGLDGQPGKKGIDDDNNGIVDDFSEQWTAGTDDEQCDPGGSCMRNGQLFAGHTCLTPGAADTCRQDGGTCQAQTNSNCSLSCQKIITNLLSLQNANPAPNGSAIPLGSRQVGMFRMIAAPAPQGQNGYQAGISHLIFTVDAANVSIVRSSVALTAVNRTDASTCTALDAQTGAPLTGEMIQQTFLASCTFDPPLGLALGTEVGLRLAMEINSNAVSSTQPSRLQVSVSRLATSDTAVAHDKSHVRWVATNAPQSWPQFRLQPDTDTVSSTLYGNLPSQCGDGLCQPSENSTLCAVDCAACGNGTKEGVEECDDGNTADGDRCSATCMGVVLLDHVKALADTNHDSTVSDAEALAITFDILDADTQPYQDVKQFDVDDPDGNTFIDGDGDVDDTDVSAIIGALDTLAP